MSNDMGITFPDPANRWGDLEQLRAAVGMESRYSGRLPEFTAAGWEVLSHGVSSPQYIGVYQTSCYTKLRRADGVEVFLVTNDQNFKVTVTVALNGFDGSGRWHNYQKTNGAPHSEGARILASARFNVDFVNACVAEAQAAR